MKDLRLNSAAWARAADIAAVTAANAWAVAAEAETDAEGKWLTARAEVAAEVALWVATQAEAAAETAWRERNKS